MKKSIIALLAVVTVYFIASSHYCIQSTKLNSFDSCFIFIKYRSSTRENDEIRVKLRSRYSIKKYELYKNINPKWEGWFLPNCDAETIKKMLSKDEKVNIEYAGLDYIGSSAGIPSENTEPDRPIIVKKPKRFKPTNYPAKINIAVIDAYKDNNINPSFIKFHSMVEGKITEQAEYHGNLIDSNLSYALGTDIVGITIHKIKVCTDTFITYRKVIKAIDSICIPNQIKIVNLSLVFKETAMQRDTTTDFLRASIKTLESTMVFICAAGNDNIDLDNKNNPIKYYPASFASEPDCKNVISVGAINSRKEFTKSNYGKKTVMVAANPKFGGYYSSFAVPIVTGLITKAYVKQKMSPEQILEWLEEHSRKRNISDKTIQTRFGYIDKFTIIQELDIQQPQPKRVSKFSLIDKLESLIDELNL